MDSCVSPLPSLMAAAAVLLLLLASLRIDVCVCVSPSDVDRHLEMGRDFLSKGHLQDALSHYHAAVEGDPSNYLTYFKRGTVYIALGKAKFGLMDLDKVLELKPDFTSAQFQRGILHLKQADIDKALVDLEQVLLVEPHNEQAMLNVEKISVVRHNIEYAKELVRGREYGNAIDIITGVIEVCPWASWLRELRAECHMALGNRVMAISDIRSTTKLQADNTAGYYKLSLLQYEMGEVAESLREIRECLKLDPEHKDCFPHYKKVKKVDKLLQDAQEALNAKDYDRCTEQAGKVLKTEALVRAVQYHAKDRLCSCYLHADKLSNSIHSCTEALEINKGPKILCDRAEAYINSEMYDDAIRDYREAIDMDDNYQRAKEGMQRAQKLQKNSERRDYYKILGVGRRATKQEITKAYRKAAQKWHPDNFQGDEKKLAEKRFIDIAAAKEVLTDDEKRRKFDNGEDPLDPEVPGQQGFNPFQRHFHDSPFQFRFHFN